MKTRRAYTIIRIDFTPFVSTALLMIVFFVWVKMEQRPNVMRVELPEFNDIEYTDLPKLDAILFLLSDNRIGYFVVKREDTQAEFTETDYSPSGIRRLLSNISVSTKNEYGAIVFIKATNQATFKNIVGIFNELKINGHVRYQMADLTPDEKFILNKYSLYKGSNPVKPSIIKVKMGFYGI